MKEPHADVIYISDDDSTDDVYEVDVQRVSLQGQEDGHPEGQPEAIKPKEGDCASAHPPAPVVELSPGRVICDLNEGGTSRTMPDGADDLPPLCIRNVVSLVDLGTKLDLELISRTLWNTKYNAKKCPVCVLMRIRRPRTTTHIFRTGKMFCFGATSMEETRKAARRHARILQKAGFPVRFLNFRITTSACTFKTFHIDLEGLIRTNPDHFSNLRKTSNSMALYRSADRIAATINRYGHVTMMGSPTVGGYKDILQTLHPILQLFRLN